ncbi:MAG: HAMP domain-containing histidine kinase [Acidobacteriia bacterium]|nr:HAMP domain-containing histidine kinase [Terriglobia bacterium]
MAINGETLQGDYGSTDVQTKGRIHRGLDAELVAGPLASFIFHDLRHPLAAILAYSEFLAEDDLDGLQRADLHQEIRLAVNRMNDLISLLSELSKGPATRRLEVTDIVETIKRAIQAVAVRPEFRRIVIRYDHDGLVKGCFDPSRLQQVIINVVLNACEAVSPDTGRIDVRSLGRQDHVEISIWDNGPGIPEPVHHAVFQPYVSYGKEGGTGLGLAIVQKILHDQGGEIYLDATGEEGTLFSLVFPYVGPRPPESLTINPAHRPMPCQMWRSLSRSAGRVASRWMGTCLDGTTEANLVPVPKTSAPCTSALTGFNPNS